MLGESRTSNINNSRVKEIFLLDVDFCFFAILTSDIIKLSRELLHSIIFFIAISCACAEVLGSVALLNKRVRNIVVVVNKGALFEFRQ